MARPSLIAPRLHAAAFQSLRGTVATRKEVFLALRSSMPPFASTTRIARSARDPLNLPRFAKAAWHGALMKRRPGSTLRF